MTPASERAEDVVEILREGAHSIMIDGTASQVGPTADDLCAAADKLEALQERVKVLEAVASDARRQIATVLRHAGYDPDKDELIQALDAALRD